MNSAQEIVEGIIQLLEKRGQLNLLPQIAELLQVHISQRSRFNTAIVRTAVALHPDEKAQLQKQLSDMFGRSLQLDEQLDTTIVGGMYIQVGDTVLDYTLSSHLKQVGEQIDK
jgi:F-type H+-transporting ATPase subunit delta